MGKSTSPEDWSGWSKALKTCLGEAGEMEWPALQAKLVSSYIEACGSKGNEELVKAAALASIPDACLSKEDSKVRLKRAAEDDDEDDEDEESEKPPPKKAKVSAGEEGEKAPPSLKLFIKGLPYSVDEASLRKDFAECGEISDLQLPMDSESGRPKGFAFITYATKEGFEAALKFDSTDYGGRTINVSEANAPGKGKDGKGKGKGKDKGKDGGGGGGGGGHDNENTVFVRGLPFSTSEEALTKDFAECGEIVRLKLPLNEEGRPKGIAFIKYTDQAGVDAALKFDSTDYGGRTINVAKAEAGGKGKGKDDKGKGKGKDDKGKGKGKKGKGKGKAPSESFAKSSGCIVAGAGEKKTFADDSDDD